MTAVIALSDVSKTFAGTRALDRINLRIAPGEMVALIGPSGSGKSSLLRAINGLMAIDRGGRVEACGEIVQSDGRPTRRARAVRARIGFVFQQFNLVGRLSLRGNVLIGSLGRIGFWRGLFGQWPPEARAAADKAMRRLGIEGQARQRARTLSGGQQQRAAIARALVQRAEVVLADEPVASLDPAAATGVMESLRDLNRRDGLTVIVSLHQVDL
ncbi:MAG: ATP-binding cassette domain-containing protein, partial [Caulobacteraceae bacterium]